MELFGEMFVLQLADKGATFLTVLVSLIFGFITKSLAVNIYRGISSKRGYFQYNPIFYIKNVKHNIEYIGLINTKYWNLKTKKYKIISNEKFYNLDMERSPFENIDICVPTDNTHN